MGSDKRTRAGAIALVALLGASACTAPEPRGERTLSTRLGALDTSSDGARAQSVRVGLAQKFRDGFAVVGELGATRFEERGAGHDTLGGDLSALLRWDAFERGPWRGFVEFGFGVVGTERDFPTGGTSLNGTRHVGAGLAYELSPSVALTASIRQRHVSNGRGLTDDNPSWDGFGAFLGLDVDLTPKDATEWTPFLAEPVEPLPFSLRTELRAGDLGDDDGEGVVLAADFAVTEALHVQARGSVDRVDDESLSELGLAAYARQERGLVGLAYDQQDLDIFRDRELTLFGEWYANDLVTVVGALGYEGRSHDLDRILGGLLLRFYLHESVVLEGGIGVRDEHDDVSESAFDVPLGLEFAPRPLREVGLALFAEDGLEDDRRVAGLRWSLGGWDSLRERDRSRGPLRRRP